MALLPIVLLSLGFSWFLASLCVFLRDIGQIVGVLTMALELTQAGANGAETIHLYQEVHVDNTP